eukprot:gene14655-biopygen21661
MGSSPNKNASEGVIKGARSGRGYETARGGLTGQGAFSLSNGGDFTPNPGEYGITQNARARVKKWRGTWVTFLGVGWLVWQSYHAGILSEFPAGGAGWTRDPCLGETSSGLCAGEPGAGHKICAGWSGPDAGSYRFSQWARAYKKFCRWRDEGNAPYTLGTSHWGTCAAAGGMEEQIEKGCGAAGAAQGERLNTCSVCATQLWGRNT